MRYAYYDLTVGQSSALTLHRFECLRPAVSERYREGCFIQTSIWGRAKMERNEGQNFNRRILGAIAVVPVTIANNAGAK